MGKRWRGLSGRAVSSRRIQRRAVAGRCVLRISEGRGEIGGAGGTSRRRAVGFAGECGDVCEAWLRVPLAELGRQQDEHRQRDLERSADGLGQARCDASAAAQQGEPFRWLARAG